MRFAPVKRDLLIAGALTLIGVATRAPYLAQIPVFEDETLQTIYALGIKPGEFMPLVGNDPYAGPLFSYLVAASMRVFGATPVAPRIVVMILGALTVGVTFYLARALGLKRPWAALAGLLMATNPLHILINSHYAGTTYILPLFSTTFLAALVQAVRRESGPWLVAAGALLGLSFQANPVLALMLPGIAIWALAQRKSAIGLRTRWPYLAAAAFALVYAPVIVYNAQTSLLGAREAEAGRQYLWQTNPSLQAFVQNLGRLALQLCRQISGVLEGEENLATLVGLPLLFSAWALAGLIYAARRGLSLPALAVVSQMLIMPWLSSHYGLTGTTRFTNQLTPLILAAMGLLAQDTWALVRTRLPGPVAARAAGVLLVALSLAPLFSLFRYYGHAEARGETNAPYFALFDDFIHHWRGEQVFISQPPGGFIVIEYFMAVSDVPYDLMPIGRILEQLATGRETGPVVLIVYDEDLPRVQSQADLVAWNVQSSQTARKLDYGLYLVANPQQVRKPAFVFADPTLAPPVRTVQADLADQLDVIGYEIKSGKVAPGGELVVNVHWQATHAMSDALTGFLHLVGPDGRLVAQDDHELGRGFYRTIFWQPGEVIREKYVLTLPKELPSGQYTLRVGAYSFPSLQRLPVRSSGTSVTLDNAVILENVRVEP